MNKTSSETTVIKQFIKDFIGKNDWCKQLDSTSIIYIYVYRYYDMKQHYYGIFIDHRRNIALRCP